MKSLFASLLLLLSVSALAADAPRAIYPDDYKRSACAPQGVCKTFDQVDFARYAQVMRKLPLHQDWVDAHWAEMTTTFAPLCDKIASCLAAPSTTDWVFCTDFMRAQFAATADRYPKGTYDYDQWNMAALVWYIGLDKALVKGLKEAQECNAASGAQAAERTMDVWVTPEKVDPAKYTGNLTVYAIDSETHVPVMAAINVDQQSLLPANDSPNGHAMTYYKFPWTLTYNFAPNAAGHRDLVMPNVVVTAPGYKTATVPIPLEMPRVVVEMTPSKLVAGTNNVTVTAKDAVTGKPVEMRVMSGEWIAGETNKPITIEVPRGKKPPEIWVTSMFNRYGDVVVAKSE
ncbi:MAG TPA: hypothetical protein VJZ00_18440 [Thermoanaerobaculia bacterium]|nr:hypothetical protein [Thermoanaerobaculia bacterium]